MKGTLRLTSLCLALPLMIGVVACAEDEPVAAPRESAPGECADSARTVDAIGAPEQIDLPAEPPAELLVEDLVVGEGVEARSGELVSYQFVAVSCATGEVLDDSFRFAQPVTWTLRESNLPPYLSEGIEGMRVGGVRWVATPTGAPPEGAAPLGAGLWPIDDSVVYVVELVATSPPLDGPVVTVPPDDAATLDPVTTDTCQPAEAPSAEGEPDVEMPEQAPTELVVEDVQIGQGATWSRDLMATVHVRILACSSGREVRSSWDAGAPEGFPETRITPAMEAALDGLQIGGRRVVLVPADVVDAGRDNPISPTVAPGESLVFIVDLLTLGAVGADT